MIKHNHWCKASVRIEYHVDDVDGLMQDSSILIAKSRLGPLLLTWFNFNPSMDK